MHQSFNLTIAIGLGTIAYLVQFNIWIILQRIIFWDRRYSTTEDYVLINLNKSRTIKIEAPCFLSSIMLYKIGKHTFNEHFALIKVKISLHILRARSYHAHWLLGPHRSETREMERPTYNGAFICLNMENQMMQVLTYSWFFNAIIDVNDAIKHVPINTYRDLLKVILYIRGFYILCDYVLLEKHNYII